MRITVEVVGHLISLVPNQCSRFVFELDEPVTIGALVDRHIQVDSRVFASFVVDGAIRKRDYLIKEDSEVFLISPAAGG